MSCQDAGALLIGESLAMRQLRALIARVAPSTVPVLIQGETGAGKELVARALHRASGRPGCLVALNVCAVADSMFEDALFGHVRGAYTGAVQSTLGYLAEADRGTLFLDEISGLSVANQLKLLRAVETKEFRPVGAKADRRSDFRVIAASNEDVTRMVETGRLRRDLAHRLGGIRVLVPPLRHRRDDIPLLAAHFAAGASRGVSEASALAASALDALCEYDWPGNVRQLRHIVEAAVTLAPSAVVMRCDVEPLLDDTKATALVRERRRRHAEDLLAMLERSQWNVDEAARQLGIHRATVYRRLKQLNLDTGPLPGVSARVGGEKMVS